MPAWEHRAIDLMQMLIENAFLHDQSNNKLLKKE